MCLFRQCIHCYATFLSGLFFIWCCFWRYFLWDNIFISLFFAKQGNPVALLIYSVLAVGIFTSFFAETLITNFAGNMKLIICVFILWRFTVRCNETVTILMATYNGSAYIENQILSLQQQKYKDWVLYIRDDGSSDNTVEIIKSFYKAMTIVSTWWRMKLRGLVRRRNFSFNC
jgi:hypothetical protein